MRIVTDSVADLPPEVAARLGICVVPLIVRFGTEEYRDGIDLSAEQFYAKLRSSPHFPATATPSPQDFADVYDRLAGRTGEILAIILSAAFSATYQAAIKGRELMRRTCRVEVLDSRLATMAEGFVVMRAAEAARGRRLAGGSPRGRPPRHPQGQHLLLLRHPGVPEARGPHRGRRRPSWDWC